MVITTNGITGGTFLQDYLVAMEVDLAVENFDLLMQSVKHSNLPVADLRQHYSVDQQKFLFA